MWSMQNGSWNKDSKVSTSRFRCNYYSFSTFCIPYLRQLSKRTCRHSRRNAGIHRHDGTGQWNAYVLENESFRKLQTADKCCRAVLKISIKVLEERVAIIFRERKIETENSYGRWSQKVTSRPLVSSHKTTWMISWQYALPDPQTSFLLTVFSTRVEQLDRQTDSVALKHSIEEKHKDKENV